MVEKAFLSVYRFLLTRKLFFILFLGGLLIALSFGVTQLKISQNINSILPEGNEFDGFQKVLDNKSLNDKVFFQIKVEENRFNAEVLESFSKALEAQVEGKLTNITIFKDDIQSEVFNFYLEQFPTLIEKKDYQFIETKLSKDSIKTALQSTYRQFVSPNAAFLKNYLRQDPIGISSKFLKSLEQQSNNQPFELEDDVMISNDGGTLLAYATLNCDSEVEKEMLYANIEAFKESWNGRDGAWLDYFGTFQIQVENSLQVKADTKLTLIITIAVILLILILYYRKLSIPLYFILPALFSALFALGLIGYINPHISGLSLATGAVLFGIVLDYSFHFFTHLRHSKSLEETLKEITVPLLTGSLTTILAFAALLFANSKILQDFGLFASLSLLGATLFTLFLLPIILHLLRFNLNRIPEENSIFKLPQLNKKHNKIALYVLAGITVFFLFFSNQISFDSDLQNLSFHKSELKQKEDRFVGLNPAEERKLFVFSIGNTFNKAIANNYELYTHLKQLQADSVINSFNNIGDFILPEPLKISRKEYWDEFWQNHPEVKSIVEIESAKLKFNDQTFEPFYQWISSNEIQEIDSSLISKLELEQLISKGEDGEYSIISSIIIPKENVDFVSKVIEDIEGVTLFNKAKLAITLIDQVKNDFNYLLLISALIVFIALLLIYGRIELALIAFLPMVISWIWILGAAALMDIKFNFVNIVIATFIFGLGDDFSIFVTDGLLSKYRLNKNSLSSFKSAIMLSALTTIIGTGFLGFAQHPAIKSIALISVLGIACIFLISVVLQPILFNIFIQNRVDNKKSPISFLELFITAYCFGFFFIGCISLMATTAILYITPISRLKKRGFLNFLVSKFAYAQIKIGFHVNLKIIDLDKLIIKEPSIIIANHSSFLDILLLLLLNPKVVLLVKDWVYKSPFFGFIIRYAGYLFTGHGAETNLEKAKQLIKEGYSIAIFPEGTRSDDGKLSRFHKGGFLLAEALNVDVTPVMIHGATEVLNKRDFLIKRGNLSVKVLPRISVRDSSWGTSYQARTKSISKFFKQQYQQFANEENTGYHIFNRVFQNYIFKGPLLEWYFRIKWRFEKGNYKFYDQLLGDRLSIIDAGCGYGYLSYYLHYRNKNRKIFGLDYDSEKIDVAKNAFDISENVQFQSSDLMDARFNPCDAIFFNDVLHYLSQKEQKLIIEKAAKSLNTNGLLVVRDGVTDFQQRHETTIKSERFSTNILKFNKKTRDFSFFTTEFVKNIALEHNFSYEMIEQSKKTSNVLFILKKNDDKNE